MSERFYIKWAIEGAGAHSRDFATAVYVDDIIDNNLEKDSTDLEIEELAERIVDESFRSNTYPYVINMEEFVEWAKEKLGKKDE